LVRSQVEYGAGNVAAIQRSCLEDFELEMSMFRQFFALNSAKNRVVLVIQSGAKNGQFGRFPRVSDIFLRIFLLIAFKI
jgi:hypothetical protein